MTPVNKNKTRRKAEKLRRLVLSLERDQVDIQALGVPIDSEGFNRAKRVLWILADQLERVAGEEQE